jgi:ubiquinone/menaquinone biosynthesis C-methylase UbiE
MTKHIQALGWEYSGTDISEAMIEEARRRAPDASFSVGNVNHIEAPDNTYDAIVAMGLVEYVEDDAVALKEMRRVLKPGGRLLVSLPNAASPARLWDRLVIVPLAALRRALGGKSKPNVFHREYLKGAYSRLVTSCGFSDVQATYYNFRVIPRPFDYWFGRLSAAISRALEPLRRTPLRFLGTGFIVEAKKSPANVS